MKIPWIRLVILGITYYLYINIVIYYYKFSPYIFIHYSYHQWLIIGPLLLLFFSVLFLLVPGWMLASLTIGGLVWSIIYFTYFYFYNPFVIGDHKLYVHSGKPYEIKYPPSWETGDFQSYVKVVYLKEPEGPDDYYRKWNYSNNSIHISYYSNKDDFLQKESNVFPGKHEGENVIMLNNRKVKVFYDRDGGSSTSSSFAQLRIPLKSKAQEGMFVIEVCRVWNDGMIINPHAISPKRLLRKALPLLEMFKILET